MYERQIDSLWAVSINRLNSQLQKWAQQASIEDRRLSQRISTDLQAHIIDEQNDTIIRAWISDISDGGFSIECSPEVNLKKGMRVKVQIFLPTDAGFSFSRTLADAFATVKRTELILSEDDHRRKIAFEFTTPQHITVSLMNRKKYNNSLDSVYFG